MGLRKWIAGMLGMVLLAAGCAPAATVPVTLEATPGLDVAERSMNESRIGESARVYLEEMTSDEMDVAIAGTDSEKAMAGYIIAAFKEMGYTPRRQSFTFVDEESSEELKSANIMVVKPGNSSKEIIVGAHYDAVDDGAGVDDNASGVAVLLEAAERLVGKKTPYTIRFIAFGAEEAGLCGSHHYVDQLSDAQIDNIVGMINLDSLVAGDLNYVYGDAGKMGRMRDWILKQAKVRGIKIATQPGDNLDDEDGTPCECADYWPFEQAEIPFAYFEATNWKMGDEDGNTQVDPDYGEDGEIRHTEYDTLEYLDETFPGRVNRHLKDFVTLLYDTLTLYKE